jgi:MerC mercury resistance protein
MRVAIPSKASVFWATAPAPCWNESGRECIFIATKRLLIFLDGIGSVGALLAAIAAPCCFPLFAGVIAALGLVALGNSESFALYALQGFALLSLFGLALAVRQHRSPWPFVLGVASLVALAGSLYGAFSQGVLYGGLFGLLAATVWNRSLMRSCVCGTPDQPSCSVPARQPVLQSIITCPECSQRTTETMPTDVCVFFYDCPACHTRLKPKQGDCCVFCSYGSVPCPPIQMEAICCT